MELKIYKTFFFFLGTRLYRDPKTLRNEKKPPASCNDNGTIHHEIETKKGVLFILSSLLSLFLTSVVPSSLLYHISEGSTREKKSSLPVLHLRRPGRGRQNHISVVCSSCCQREIPNRFQRGEGRPTVPVQELEIPPVFSSPPIRDVVAPPRPALGIVLVSGLRPAWRRRRRQLHLPRRVPARVRQGREDPRQLLPGQVRRRGGKRNKKKKSIAPLYFRFSYSCKLTLTPYRAINKC